MEELINCVRNGANPSVTCFSSCVSNGSSALDVVGDLVMSLRKSDINAVANVCTRGTLGLCGSSTGGTLGLCGPSASMLRVTAELLATVARDLRREKKWRNVLEVLACRRFVSGHADCYPTRP